MKVGSAGLAIRMGVFFRDVYTGVNTEPIGDFLSGGLLVVMTIYLIGFLMTLPAAFICAAVYLRAVRPMLLKRGWVVDPGVIDTLAMQRRRAAKRRRAEKR